jgi:hypothetical protein
MTTLAKNVITYRVIVKHEVEFWNENFLYKISQENKFLSKIKVLINWLKTIVLIIFFHWKYRYNAILGKNKAINSRILRIKFRIFVCFEQIQSKTIKLSNN